MGFGNRVEDITVEILDVQQQQRHKVCRENNISVNPGPQILAALRPELSKIINKKQIASPLIDELFCLGILWNETDNCSVYWHSLV